MICYSIGLQHFKCQLQQLIISTITTILQLFARYSPPLIICCHGPGKGWIMDHALVTLIVINLSAVMTHVSDTVKLWSALSLLCHQFPLLIPFSTFCTEIIQITALVFQMYVDLMLCYNVEVCAVITLQHVYITRNPGETCVQSPIILSCHQCFVNKQCHISHELDKSIVILSQNVAF